MKKFKKTVAVLALSAVTAMTASLTGCSFIDKIKDEVDHHFGSNETETTACVEHTDDDFDYLCDECNANLATLTLTADNYQSYITPKATGANDGDNTTSWNKVANAVQIDFTAGNYCGFFLNDLSTYWDFEEIGKKYDYMTAEIYYPAQTDMYDNDYSSSRTNFGSYRYNTGVGAVCAFTLGKSCVGNNWYTAGEWVKVAIPISDLSDNIMIYEQSTLLYPRMYVRSFELKQNDFDVYVSADPTVEEITSETKYQVLGTFVSTDVVENYYNGVYASRLTANRTSTGLGNALSLSIDGTWYVWLVYHNGNDWSVGYTTYNVVFGLVETETDETETVTCTHVDSDSNYYCDNCNTMIDHAHVDSDNDDYCDYCNFYMDPNIT